MQETGCVFVIIGFQNPRMTAECVESCHRHSPNASVWLYDNASSPPLRPVAEQFGIPYLYSPENLGFAGGANRAIEWILADSDARAICLLNNDVLVPPGFDASLGKEIPAFLQNTHMAAMAPLLFTDRDLRIPENFGVRYYQSGLAFQNRTGKLEERVLLNAAFLFLKASVCKQLVAQDGFVFRPAYFFNAEDIELSLRLLSRGFTIQVNPNLRAQHLGSQSSRASTTSFRLSWRNLLWTLIITRSARQLIRDSFFILAGQLVLMGLSVLRGEPAMFAGVYLETLRNRHTLAQAHRDFLRLSQHDLAEFIKPGVFSPRRF